MKRVDALRPGACLLLVEGRHDARFLQHLARDLQIENLQTREAGGTGNFKAELTALTLDPGFWELKALGLIRDADDEPQQAWESLQGLLKRLELPVPSEPGIVVQANQLRIGASILPGSSPGMLEDLLWASVQERPQIGAVKLFMDRLDQDLLPQLRPRIPAKARLKAFLAAQRDDYPDLGVAAREGLWDFKHPALEPLRRFLLDLSGQNE